MSARKSWLGRLNKRTILVAGSLITVTVLGLATYGMMRRQTETETASNQSTASSQSPKVSSPNSQGISPSTTPVTSSQADDIDNQLEAVNLDSLDSGLDQQFNF